MMMGDTGEIIQETRRKFRSIKEVTGRYKESEIIAMGLWEM